MAVIVVGGHSRDIGKTSVVAGLIGALPERNWLAIKITQFGHHVCSKDGSSCNCAPSGRSWAMSEELDRDGSTDTSRFLAAGAKRSLWVRTREGMLSIAMPQLRIEIAKSGNTIIESNSILKYIRPDLYVSVLDPSTEDFKPSAREFLDRADAVLLHGSEDTPRWQGVSLKPVAEKPFFLTTPPAYLGPEFLQWVRTRLSLS